MNFKHILAKYNPVFLKFELIEPKNLIIFLLYNMNNELNYNGNNILKSK